MKIVKYFLATLILTIAVIIVTIDAKLYYYGENYWPIHRNLPLKIVPSYWGYDYGNLGFVLENQDGVTVVAPGSEYYDSESQVKEILKYGFDKEKLVALILDSLGERHIIECISNNVDTSKGPIVINVLEEGAVSRFKGLKWIDIKDISTRPLRVSRNYLIILWILLIGIFVYVVISGESRRQGN